MMEIQSFVFYAILEVVILMALLVLYQWRLIRRYKPYYIANRKPTIFIRRYLEKALKYTRDYANSLKGKADEGKKWAIEHRQNLVARLNWLVLERDFLTDDKPDRPYWNDMNARITRLLKQWDLVGFTDGRPDADAVTRTLTDDDRAAIAAAGDDLLPDLPREKVHHDHADLPAEIDPAVKARIKFLERQVHQLDAYQKMFFGLQETYNGLKTHYRKMKNELFGLKISAEHAEELKVIIQQHEMHEQEMEDKLHEVERNSDRLNEEIHQMEETYNLQIQQLEEKLHDHDSRMDSGIDSVADSSLTAPLGLEDSSFDDANAEISETAEMLRKSIAREDGFKISDIMDNQTVRIRELIAAIHELSIDLDSKMELEERIEQIEKANLELITAMQVIGLEAKRLQNATSDSQLG